MNMYMLLPSLDLIFNGLGIPLDVYIIIIITISSLILSAQSIKIGLTMTLLLFAITYITYRFLSMDTTFALYAIFVSLILMTLSIYTTKGGTVV